MTIKIELNSYDFEHSFKHEGREYTGFKIKYSEKTRMYITAIKDQMKMKTIAKQMKFEDGNVIISFGKNDKLVIGTYSEAV